MGRHTLTVLIHLDIPGPNPDAPDWEWRRRIENAIKFYQYTIGEVTPIDPPDPIWPDIQAFIASHMHGFIPGKLSTPTSYDQALRHLRGCTHCQGDPDGKQYLDYLESVYSFQLDGLREVFRQEVVKDGHRDQEWWEQQGGPQADWERLQDIHRRYIAILEGKRRSEHYTLRHAFRDFYMAWHTQ